MNTERLLKLAEFLETKVPKSRFDMSGWADGDLQECGTAACALGWATECFKDEGLHLVVEGMGYVPDFNGCSGFSAGAKFFDVSSKQSESLFDPSDYCDEELDDNFNVPVHAVATRIRQMVAEHLSVTP